MVGVLVMDTTVHNHAEGWNESWEAGGRGRAVRGRCWRDRCSARHGHCHEVRARIARVYNLCTFNGFPRARVLEWYSSVSGRAPNITIHRHYRGTLWIVFFVLVRFPAVVLDSIALLSLSCCNRGYRVHNARTVVGGSAIALWEECTRVGAPTAIRLPSYLQLNWITSATA